MKKNESKDSGDVLRITVKVRPKSGRQKILLCDDGSLKVFLRSPPEDGKANEELIDYLSKSLRISRASVKINCGLKGRNKILEFSDIKKESFHNLISQIVSS